jgi:molecular chaperone GrpE
MTQEPIPDKSRDEQAAETPEVNGAGQKGEEPTVELLSAEIVQLRTTLAELQKSADQFKDQLLRKAAEFENYRRRSEAEFSAVIKNANESLLLSILPIVDDFSRSLKAGKNHDDFAALNRGVELIHNKLLRILESEGVKPFESVGKPFSVDFHDALLQIPRADVEPHTVIEEIERGYMYKDRVLRHAKVIVSTAPEITDTNAGEPNEGEQKEPNG